MKLLASARVPGGWQITVEIPGVFARADGTLEAGTRSLFVPAELVSGRSREEVLTNLVDLVTGADPIDEFVGQPLEYPMITPSITHTLTELYELWWQMKQTRIEAQARAMAPGVIAAILTVENNRWEIYRDAVIATVGG